MSNAKAMNDPDYWASCLALLSPSVSRSSLWGLYRVAHNLLVFFSECRGVGEEGEGRDKGTREVEGG